MKKSRKTKKGLAIILSSIMCVSLFATTVNAKDIQTPALPDNIIGNDLEDNDYFDFAKEESIECLGDGKDSEDSSVSEEDASQINDEKESESETDEEELSEEQDSIEEKEIVEENDSEDLAEEIEDGFDIGEDELGNYEEIDSDISTCPSGINHNGDYGIYIDINAHPYTTYQNKAAGSYAYGNSGCAWFAAARHCQLTGREYNIWSGQSWWNKHAAEKGYAKGSECRAYSFACYTNHIAVVEQVSGNNVVITEGGTSAYSDANHGYCTIRRTTISALQKSGTKRGDFLGYVYFSEGPKNPKIAFDYAGADGVGKILVTGWAFDEDNVNTAIAVHVYAYVNKDYNTPYFLGETIANVSRPDVNDAFGCGNYHGFCASFPSPVSGTVEVNVAAINIGSGDNVWASGKFINVERDTQKPVISNVRVSNISSSGYTVTCNVSDNVAVKKVAFPTWTANGGQDDLAQYWWETKLGTNNNGTFTFRVNTGEHNGEQNCMYLTHIYAYDYMGNESSISQENAPCLYLYVCDVVNELSDVKPGQWYTDAIQYVYSRRIMTGNSSKKFVPNGNISRGEFTTVLYSMAGKPGTSYQAYYPDVKQNAYYAIPITWATNNGIVAGVGGGRFRPNSSVTREQIAVMLYAYAKKNGFNLGINANALNGFSDKGQVSSYATEAMRWAVTQKIISGTGSGKLSPKGEATRAQCAAMIKTFLDSNGR